MESKTLGQTKFQKKIVHKVLNRSIFSHTIIEVGNRVAVALFQMPILGTVVGMTPEVDSIQGSMWIGWYI